MLTLPFLVSLTYLTSSRIGSPCSSTTASAPFSPSSTVPDPATSFGPRPTGPAPPTPVAEQQLQSSGGRAVPLPRGCPAGMPRPSGPTHSDQPASPVRPASPASPASPVRPDSARTHSDPDKNARCGCLPRTRLPSRPPLPPPGASIAAWESARLFSDGLTSLQVTNR